MCSSIPGRRLVSKHILIWTFFVCLFFVCWLCLKHTALFSMTLFCNFLIIMPLKMTPLLSTEWKSFMKKIPCMNREPVLRVQQQGVALCGRQTVALFVIVVWLLVTNPRQQGAAALHSHSAQRDSGETFLILHARRCKAREGRLKTSGFALSKQN